MIIGARGTSKGQVTLPEALRKSLGVGTGADLEFEETAGGTVVRVVHRQHLAEYLGALRTSVRFPDHAAERRAAARRLAERGR